MKIKGIGVDIESIQRFKDTHKDKSFINLIFTKKEISYCEKKKEPHISFAGRFCAKEAVIKAHNSKLAMKDIEIINEDSGKLKVHIKNTLKPNIHCSISHTNEYATAFVIIEEENE
tara:strand:- start:303 stop:650 length:348 start_codon:yes stop_codon:yes gene_type:complete